MINIVDPHEITIEDVRANHNDGHIGFIWECPNCRGAWVLLQQEKNIMHTGMLWFDNSSATLQAKLQKAVDYYKKKYGRSPDLCLVHPTMLENNGFEIQGLTVRPYRPVLKGHIWIGIEDKQEVQS